jgi:hypothetical protein
MAALLELEARWLRDCKFRDLDRPPPYEHLLSTCCQIRETERIFIPLPN